MDDVWSNMNSLPSLDHHPTRTHDHFQDFFAPSAATPGAGRATPRPPTTMLSLSTSCFVRQRSSPVEYSDKFKRLMKNRASAARSRARKQARADELEQEIVRLTKENAKLKRLHEELSSPSTVQVPKKPMLHRTKKQLEDTEEDEAESLEKRSRRYIARERELAEEKLRRDYFRDENTPPVYPEEYFRRKSTAQENYVEGCSMQRPPLLEPNRFCFWKARFETFIKSKDIDLWQVIQNGDFVFEIEDPKTKMTKDKPYELLEDDEKKQLGKNNEAKMTLYNALSCKEAKVTTIEEAKDLATLPLDELFRNLKVYEMILENDGVVSTTTTKHKVKSIALKAKFRRGHGISFRNKGGESSKQKGVCYNCEIEFHFASECRKPKENKAFIEGAWSDSEDGDVPQNDATYLMAIDYQETFNWETATYNKDYCDDLDSFTDFEIDFLAIVYNDASTSNQNVFSEPTMCLKFELLPDDWIMDSGCTKHMIENRIFFTSYKAYDGGHGVFGSNLKGKVVSGGNITHDSITITNVEHSERLAQMSFENGVNPPAPNPSHNSNFSLLSVLGRERLTGPNMDWMRNLRFTIRYENKECVLDEHIPTINDDSTQEGIEAHQKHYDDANKVSCIMASSMSPELQKTFENTWAYEMNQHLKEMFQTKVSKERLDVVKSLMACKLKPGASICAFVLEMKGYFDRLESLNMVFDAELSINIILSGLLVNYNQFVLSYQMNRKDTSIMKFHSLLQTAEQGIKKIDVSSTLAAPVLTVGHNAKKRKTSHSNWKGNEAQGKSDRRSKRKVEYEIAPTSDPKEAVCFYCNTKGPKTSEGP
ncbi:retrotransposon protein, putative, ty1-copia subclass [Tanacetum coccineum]